ncbi:MAG: T9SS type A sorting domain-containing protein, partial [Bacteroidetes bacterium]|nr:T9SS type A sorting domain-containing protein [Bacteroidota bacterium]
VMAQHDLEKTTELPGWHVQLWENVERTDLWWFGWYSAPLGDINGDGYDDLAVSSAADTTFIFLGGDPFNHQEAFIVRGGSAGIASADFNRDGRMDIVTAIEYDGPGEYYPDFRGAVRIYLQKISPPYFTLEADLLIEGDSMDQVGRNINPFRGSVIVLDFNGDGWPDLLTKSWDHRDSVRWKGVLYLGGPAMDAVPDAEFKVPIPLTIGHDYMADALVGDINGDGYDDVLIAGTGPRGPGEGEYWDLFFGNPWAIAIEPQRIIRKSNGWAPKRHGSTIMDVNADGYDDILCSTAVVVYGNALLFRGSASLPERILPNDSILNSEPYYQGDLSPSYSCPVGDMNGDGTDDLVMAWHPYFVFGTPYYFYPCGPLFREPVGWFGTNPTFDNVEPGVHPAGDLNGDGYDDIITLGKGSHSYSDNRFQIWLGARQLSTAVESPPTPSVPILTLSPNPLPSDHRQLRVVAEGARPGSVDVLITDLLGRVHSSRSCDFTGHTPELTLALPVLPAGVYLLTLRQGNVLAQQKLLVY